MVILTPPMGRGFWDFHFVTFKAKNVQAIDSNGAGDIFAGAALNKIIEEDSFLNACKFGNYASSIIVQEKSPRLSIDQYKKLKADYWSDSWNI